MFESYQSWEAKPDDSPAERRSKLYLAVCSTGDRLYSMGSALREQQKVIESLEKTVAAMRRELKAIKIVERGGHNG